MLKLRFRALCAAFAAVGSAAPIIFVSAPVGAVTLPLPAPKVTAPVLVVAGNAILAPSALLTPVSPQISNAVASLGSELRSAGKPVANQVNVDPLAVAYQAAGGKGTPPALNSVANVDLGATHVVGPNPTSGNPLGISVGSATQAKGTLLDLGVLSGGKPVTISLHGN